MIFQRILGGAGIDVLVRPSRLDTFRPDAWWQSRETIGEGVYEWQKLMYYWLFE